MESRTVPPDYRVLDFSIEAKGARNGSDPRGGMRERGRRGEAHVHKTMKPPNATCYLPYARSSNARTQESGVLPDCGNYLKSMVSGPLQGHSCHNAQKDLLDFMPFDIYCLPSLSLFTIHALLNLTQ